MKQTEQFSKAVRELEKKNQKQRKAGDGDAADRAYRIAREKREAYEKELAERTGEATAKAARSKPGRVSNRRKANWY